jgi:hypothetical protein
MMISSQPASRNFGKNGSKILFEKRAMKTKSYEKIEAKIFARIRAAKREHE